MKTENEAMLAAMKEAAMAGVGAIAAEKKKGISGSEKSPKEFVTNCDLASEKAIMDILKRNYPDSSILSEEAGEIKGNGLMWIIDPIDGTHNFMFGLPMYGISIAAYQMEQNKIIAGVIYLPEFDAMYAALLGGGAFLNDKGISVSKRENLTDCMVAYDNQFHKHKAMLINLGKLAPSCFTVRIFGSAVCDLAHVAEGVLDARVFHNTKLVDFAAGSLIVREAGGKVTNFKGEDVNLKTTDVVASNGKIHEQLCALLNSDQK